MAGIAALWVRLPLPLSLSMDVNEMGSACVDAGVKGEYPLLGSQRQGRDE